MQILNSINSGLEHICGRLLLLKDSLCWGLRAVIEKITQIVKNIFLKILKTVLVIAFPGTFVLGVLSTALCPCPEKIQKQLETIQNIWKKASYTLCAVMTLIYAYALPVSPLISAFLYGADWGSHAAIASRQNETLTLF